MDEKILLKIRNLLKVYGCDDQEIENFMTDLVEEKKEQLEEDDDWGEYNPQERINNILGKDIDLNKDKDLQDLIAKKYSN